MSGHKSRRNNLTTRTPDAQAIAQLDQLAAAVADARQQPNMMALAAMEEGFLNAYLQGSPFGNALDPLTVGAAWMIVGNLFASHINTMPEDQRSGPAQLANLARLAGQRLYTGDRLPVTIACPYTYATGAPCTTTRTGSTQEQADKLMGAHVWQNHPDKEWPPVEDADSADDDAAEAVNLAPTDPAAQAAAMRDLEGEFPDDGDEVPENRRELRSEPRAYIGGRRAQHDGDADDDGAALCACGKPAELVVGELPKEGPGSARSVCLECAGGPQVDVDPADFRPVGGVEKSKLSELIDRAARAGLCSECGLWVYLDDDGRIGFHPTGEDGNQRTCPGAGGKPSEVSAGGETPHVWLDGEVEG